MQHLDEGTMHAWLDGELPPAERQAAEAHVASCDECKAAVAEVRGFMAASSRILTALDAVPGGVLPASSTAAKTRAPAKFTISRAWMAAAAVLVLSTATMIAVRPRGDTAARRVAEAAKEEKATVMAPNIGAAKIDTAIVGAPARMKDSSPKMMADASPAAQTPAPAPPRFGDTAWSRPMALNSVAVTGAGTMTAVGKLDAAMASDILLKELSQICDGVGGGGAALTPDQQRHCPEGRCDKGYRPEHPGRGSEGEVIAADAGIHRMERWIEDSARGVAIGVVTVIVASLRDRANCSQHIVELADAPDEIQQAAGQGQHNEAELGLEK